MMDAIHIPALSAQRCSFRSGKKTLHGNVTNRLLSIFEVIGDVASLYCGCLRHRNM